MAIPRYARTYILVALQVAIFMLQMPTRHPQSNRTFWWRFKLPTLCEAKNRAALVLRLVPQPEVASLLLSFFSHGYSMS